MSYRGNTPINHNVEYNSQYERDSADKQYWALSNHISDLFGGFKYPMLGALLLFSLVTYVLEIILNWFTANQWIFYLLAALAVGYLIFILVKLKLRKDNYIREEKERKALYEKYMKEAKDNFNE